MDIENVNRIDTHCHSMYSNIRLIDSINRPKDMILTASSLGLRGIALTDHEALCGAVEWLQIEKELKEKEKIDKDFKCILGNEIYLTETRGPKQRYWHFILLAKDTIGFRGLCKLSSNSWYYSYSDRGMERVPTLKKELEELMKEYKGHIVATNACIGGELGGLVLELCRLEETNASEASIYQQKLEIVNFLNWCKEIFGDDFYVECAPGTSEDQIRFNKRIREIAPALGFKMIFATDAHYLTIKDRSKHKGYLNSKEGDREVDDFYKDAHMMDNKEAFENLSIVFTEEEFIEMCNNSMEIYDKIGTYDIFHKPIIPRVDVKDYPRGDKYGVSEYPVLSKLLVSSSEQERYWANQCLEGLKNKKLWNDKYLSRLETEADVIDTIGQKLENCLFEYFNTFQHYIDLFWECGSLSGPGRGSSVCFLSDYLLGITQLDPVEWNLDYWRFLNKERLELPDIDTDLSPSKRKLIFEKIREERGELNLVQVATFGTEGTRSAILASCRGYRSEEFPNGIDVDIGQYMTGLIPQERGFLWSIHDVVYGDEEKDRKPVKAFIDEVNKYPGLLENIMSIEGLVCRRGQHASGVMMYNNSPFDTTALMRSPNGDITTQFALHESEALGDTKFDFLVTEICDKITNCINLLKDNGYFSECNTLREIYEKYLHPASINLNDDRIWNSLALGDTMDVFQFNSEVGLQAAKQTKPKNPIEMMMANAVMRLTAEKGKERPLDRYVRLKNDMSQWYSECRKAGLTEEEIKYIEPYYLPSSGCPTTQEKLMLLCMDQHVAKFSLSEANKARKICAKKKISEVPALKEKFIGNCDRKELGEYVWKTAIEPQMSYAFAEPHALAYSFVGIQTLVLATNYPQIFWNCACLITNSGGDEEKENENPFDTEEVDIYEEEDFENYEYEDAPDRKSKKKKKVKNTNYGKISIAIGQMSQNGIVVSPPDINRSSFTFTPIVEENKIIYGLKGISHIGADLVQQIMISRPYSSVSDFLSKIKINKIQMINLIKSGAFDNFDERETIMYQYIESIAELKNKLTLSNLNMLIERGLIPQEQFDFEIRTFNFNKYLKKMKAKDEFIFDDVAMMFYERNFDVDKLEFDDLGVPHLNCAEWKKVYDKVITPLKSYIKENSESLLQRLNENILDETWDKYCKGTLSKWEMDSVGFYSHEHELERVNHARHGFGNYFKMPYDPKVEKTFETRDGKIIPIYKIERIAGTVLDKDKNKKTITLLTKYGVVTVKVFGPVFANYDKRISEVGADGKKHVVEESWIKRGNKIIVTGIRNGDVFIAKKYKSTPYHLIELITEINEDGTFETRVERLGEESEAA